MKSSFVKVAYLAVALLLTQGCGTEDTETTDLINGANDAAVIGDALETQVDSEETSSSGTQSADANEAGDVIDDVSNPKEEDTAEPEGDTAEPEEDTTEPEEDITEPDGDTAAPASGTCEDACGGLSADGTCSCEGSCKEEGTCCPDVDDFCTFTCDVAGCPPDGVCINILGGYSCHPVCSFANGGCGDLECTSNPTDGPVCLCPENAVWNEALCISFQPEDCDTPKDDNCDGMINENCEGQTSEPSPIPQCVCNGPLVLNQEGVCACPEGFSLEGEVCINIDECNLENPSSIACQVVDELCLDEECYAAVNGLDPFCDEDNWDEFCVACASSQPGYSGLDCSSVGEACVNLSPPPCPNNAQCTDTEGSYLCECISGFLKEGEECVALDCSLEEPNCADPDFVCEPQGTIGAADTEYSCIPSNAYTEAGMCQTGSHEIQQSDGSYQCIAPSTLACAGLDNGNNCNYDWGGNAIQGVCYGEDSGGGSSELACVPAP